jgi:hypothetical protein
MLNCLSLLSIGNYIAKSSEDCTFKEGRKESITKVYQVVD